MPSKKKTAASAAQIVQSIVYLRGHKVLLDAELATLYGVETRVLVQAVKRNLERFPEDFMFQLSTEELEVLRSQFVISNAGRGGRRYAPYAFTEQGVAMLSSVVNSPRVNASTLVLFPSPSPLMRRGIIAGKPLAALRHSVLIAGIPDAR